MDAVQSLARTLDQLKPLPNEAAWHLCQAGVKALDFGDLSTDRGTATRQNKRIALVRLRDEVLPSAGDPVDEPTAAAIRNKVTDAFIEARAAGEAAGADYNLALNSTVDFIATLPQELARKAGELVSGAAGIAGEAAGGFLGGLLSGWGGLALVAIGGYLIWKAVK